MRVATTIGDAWDYLSDLCEDEKPTISMDDFREHLREHYDLWDFGDDMDNAEHGLGMILREMVEYGYAWK
jgi:hypothetical protein